MRHFRIALIAMFSVLTLSIIANGTDVRLGLSAGDDGIKSFYLSIGEQYRVPEREVVVIREKKFSDDELPVVFFIARNAKVEPDAVVQLRLSGKSWMDITLHFGLSPAIYYVAFEKDPGPPYGKAWGYYKNHKKEEWKTIRLADTDVVNFVNVKFMCDRYGYTPAQVIQMRNKNESFVFVNSKIKKHKEGKSKEHADSDNPGKGKSKNGKGKDK